MRPLSHVSLDIHPRRPCHSCLSRIRSFPRHKCGQIDRPFDKRPGSHDYRLRRRGWVLDHKLTAILSADVFGYSRLMGENEEATLRALSSHRKLIDSLISRITDASLIPP